MYCRFANPGKKLKFFFTEEVHLGIFTYTEYEMNKKRPRKKIPIQPLEIDVAQMEKLKEGKELFGGFCYRDI